MIDKIPTRKVEKEEEPVEVHPGPSEGIKEYAQRINDAAREHAVTGLYGRMKIDLPKGDHDPYEIVRRWHKLVDEEHGRGPSKPDSEG